APPCLSAACDWASARLSAAVDPFAQPCDYFLFTCGANNVTADNRGHPQNRSGRSTLEDAPRGGGAGGRRGSLLQNLRQILAALQNTRTFYSSCLDTGSVETAGVEPFLSLIQEQLGGWAVSGQWVRPEFNSTLGVLMRDYATFPFFRVYVDTDPEDVHGLSKRYIQIDQPDLLIPIEWNNETKRSQVETQTLRPFLSTCQRYLTLLGAPDDKSLHHVGHFLSLSSELAVAASPPRYRLSKGQLYQRMSIRDLQLQAPDIDWLGCLQTTFEPLNITEDDQVFVHNLPFMVNMSLIVRKWKNKPENSNDPLQTFMVLNLLHTMMPALDSRFPRWQRCVTETEKGFSPVLTHLLSQGAAHREAQEIIQDIFSAFLSVTPRLLGNRLLFPMGLFVPPLFHPTYPAMNYGVVGFLVAKDLLHLLLPNGGCVWTHYLTVTDRAGGAGGGGGAALTAAQQQELWVQYTALQTALQAYQLNLETRPEDTSISGLSYTRLFLSSFSQMNCDSDPHHESMPLQPSFLITVFCAGSDLCPSDLRCPRN
uniref:Kell metallo-endopeptidase (Kell blood group) n=1 Tax=Cynoglossus semilaevis TaxID=244447 RepID=A0A3P8WVG3_CYNSE